MEPATNVTPTPPAQPEPEPRWIIMILIGVIVVLALCLAVLVTIILNRQGVLRISPEANTTPTPLDKLPTSPEIIPGSVEPVLIPSPTPSPAVTVPPQATPSPIQTTAESLTSFEAVLTNADIASMRYPNGLELDLGSLPAPSTININVDAVGWDAFGWECLVYRGAASCSGRYPMRGTGTTTMRLSFDAPVSNVPSTFSGVILNDGVRSTAVTFTRR